nr:unnamed protein product [Naegleria fowleri]
MMTETTTLSSSNNNLGTPLPPNPSAATTYEATLSSPLLQNVLPYLSPRSSASDSSSKHFLLEEIEALSSPPPCSPSSSCFLVGPPAHLSSPRVQRSLSFSKSSANIDSSSKSGLCDSNITNSHHESMTCGSIPLTRSIKQQHSPQDRNNNCIVSFLSFSTTSQEDSQPNPQPPQQNHHHLFSWNSMLPKATLTRSGTKS